MGTVGQDRRGRKTMENENYICAAGNRAFNIAFCGGIMRSFTEKTDTPPRPDTVETATRSVLKTIIPVKYPGIPPL